MSDTPKTSAEWLDDIIHVVQYLNANPHVVATYPSLEPVAGYLRDMSYVLALKEAELAEAERSKRIHLEALAESEAAGQKAEQDREKVNLALEYCGNECKLAMDKAIKAEKERDEWKDHAERFLERAEKAEAREAAMVAELDTARREPYQIIWRALRQAGVTRADGCPDSIVIEEIEKGRQAEAREAALRTALVNAAIPLEVLAGQISQKPYGELTGDLQNTICETVMDISAALTAHTEAGEWRGLWRCVTCGYEYTSLAARERSGFCTVRHNKGDDVTLVPHERRKGGA